jgi:hypothetical protein
LRREKISRSEVDHLGSVPKRPVLVLPGEGRLRQAPEGPHGDESLRQAPEGLHGDGKLKLKPALVLHGDGNLAVALFGRGRLNLSLLVPLGRGRLNLNLLVLLGRGKLNLSLLVLLGSGMHKLGDHHGGVMHKLGEVLLGGGSLNLRAGLLGSGKPRLKLRALPGERLTQY